ncbi:MAG: hypothetical protein GXO62_06135 [Epsilonproteobacteria bacterium]|nr:hypothetical protein [Campylobacterota bacterium]
MKVQLLLTPTGVKYLLAKALLKKIDFSKRVYIAYGSTNQILLEMLGIEFDDMYVAGCFASNKLNVTVSRPKIVVLKDKKPIDIAEFEITKEDYFIKGANALWYENGIKHAAVAAADENGGTFGNFYVKAAARGAKVIIPVSHEKLIPFYVSSTQNVDLAMGSKIAMMRFFYGQVFSEIEAFKELFGVDARVIASGGIAGNEGSLVFEIEGERAKEAYDFAVLANEYIFDKKAEFVY